MRETFFLPTWRHALMAVLILYLVACGGGGGGSNSPPSPTVIAQDNDYTVAKGATATIPTDQGVLSNDSSSNGVLIATLIQAPSHSKAFNLNADGSFSYEDDGTATTDQFIYRADDGDGTSDTATVTLTIDSPPSAVDECRYLDRDPVTNPSLAVSGQLDATDPDGGTLTYRVSGPGPSNGSVVINPDGSYQYTLSSSSIATVDTFGYEVVDASGFVGNGQIVIIPKPRVMPLGDSIVAGTEDSAAKLPSQDQRISYRKALLDTLTNVEGFVDPDDGSSGVDLVGSVDIDGTAVAGFDNDHEGHGGFLVNEITSGRSGGLDGRGLPYTGIFNALDTNPAEYILLHIGTNDVAQGVENPDDINTLLDAIDSWEQTSGRHVTVILARIIDQGPNFNGKVTPFNDAVVSRVQARINNGDDIIIVDQENALDYATQMGDDLHPNQSGYSTMASVWLFPLTGNGTSTGTGTGDPTGAHVGPGGILDTFRCP